VPTGAGTITTVNANGDPCDQYYNILLNPNFVNLYTGNLGLRENSPCIDAGDPALPQDPDGTVADQGAIYFFQCPIFVNIGSPTPCIIIPAGGGSFSYWVRVQSNYSSTYTFDIWTDAILPGGGVFGPVLSRSNLVIPSGASIQRTLTQSVPGSAPAGFYYLRVNVGFLPDSVVDCDSIPFLKLAGDNVGSNDRGWLTSGWDDEAISAVVSEFALHPPSPNPFNPETRLSFTLPEAGYTSLVVYDVQGKEITRLADGWSEAGAHNLTFNAASLSSGVYFAVLQENGLTQTRKLLLVK